MCSRTLLNASTIPRWGRPRLRECPRLTEAEKLYLTPRTQFSSPDSMASPCKHLSALPDSQLLPWIISELAAHSSSREGVGQPLTCGCMCPANGHEALPCRTRALLVRAANCLKDTTWSGAQPARGVWAVGPAWGVHVVGTLL